MTVIAPSTVSNAPAVNPMQALGEVRQEDFLRRMAGLDNMQGGELEQFQRRQEADTARQGQMELIDSILADREQQAEEMAEDLQASGLSDVAERFRRRSRRSSFNLARRGLAGGSAAAEQEAAIRSQAEQEGAQATEQARMSVIQEMLRAQQQRDKLAQQAIQQNPFLATEEVLRTQGVEQAGAEQSAIQRALAEIETAQRGGRLGQAQALAGILGGIGGGLGNIIGGS